MGKILDARRRDTAKRVEELRGELEQAKNICRDVACVYATGSFGRREAGQYSDLDVFIAGKGIPDKPDIRGLDEILIKADLIAASRKLGFPDFSGEGEYLKHYTVGQFVTKLGTREDDVTNTFTARLLLLLESFSLVGELAYRDVTSDVIAAYWRDYQDHRDDFMPAFLANDILRMWRTFCVNYEAGTKDDPPAEKAKRKLKNYKLKHSRLLTCYSALLYLLSTFRHKQTVSPTDAAEMISLTPTERIERLLEDGEVSQARGALQEILAQYDTFLSLTDASSEELIPKFLDRKQSAGYFAAAYKFGDLMYEALTKVGDNTRFYRLLVV